MTRGHFDSAVEENSIQRAGVVGDAVGEEPGAATGERGAAAAGALATGEALDVAVGVRSRRCTALSSKGSKS